ncbi:hypothetical protein JTE90_006852 [Oedothorax gibbosus]|uniref:RNA helicase n=1 Tax=Oedothorax gibbosus TaxID=931172 RepID=A0AAV6TVV6_9ARAC|nr:hypothetical protein JTE90_006852 [Oedothorax gibbosus]
MIPFRTLYLHAQRAYSAQAPLPVPVIKIPKYVTKYVEKAKKKGLIKEFNNQNRKKIAYRGDTSKPVISSTNGDFNFYLGQTYHDNYPLPIQSKFWFKQKSSGQKFTIHPIEPNPSIQTDDPHEFKNDEHFPSEFTKFDLNQNIIDNIYKEFEFKKPTRMQTLAIPRISSGCHVLLASETGSGKTVSYLAPIIQNLIKLKSRNSYSDVDSPLALVLVPGRELAEQIAEVAFKLAKRTGVDVRVLLSPGTKQDHLKLVPESNIDVLVASIGCFKKFLERDKFSLGNLQHFVLDEADTLLDDSFVEDTKSVMRKMMIKSNFSLPPVGAQVVLSSSIYPSNIGAIVDETFPEESITEIISPYLHRVPMHISQKFCRVSQDGRAGELLDLVKNDFKKKKPVMIFCNQSHACDWLVEFLESSGIPCGKFHGGIVPNIRMKMFNEFKEGSLNVLVCTDLASRGLDTSWVRHVINWDFPNNVSDYLLRAGRVGRAGTNQGHVTNLVVNKSTVYTVHEVETAVRLRRRIANVDSNVKQKIRKLFFQEMVDPRSMPV